MRNFIFSAENFDSCTKMRHRLPKFKMAAEAQMLSAKKAATFPDVRKSGLILRAFLFAKARRNPL